MLTFSFQIKYLGLIIALLCLSCNSPDQTATTRDKTEYPDQEGWNSTLIVTNEGRKSLRIEYGHMEKFDQRKLLYFGEKVKLDLYAEDGSLKTKLVADSALLNEANNNMEAIGNVIVIKGDTTLYTTRLKWFEQPKLIVCDVPFTMVTQQNDTLYGDGFEMDQRTNYMRIKMAEGVSHEKLDIKGTSKRIEERPKKTIPSQSEPEDSSAAGVLNEEYH